jgi:LPXTG-site transpeptidase (sortase) family protein
MHNEPTLHKLELLIEAFRMQGGSDAEISLITQDIVRELNPDKIKPVKEFFSGNKHSDVQKIFDFKNDPKHPIKDATETAWNHWYVKYPTIFISLFILIFSVINLPLFITKMTPTQETETVTTKIETIKTVVQPEMEKSAPLDPGEIIPNINTLVVPKININAPIVFIDSTDEKAIQDNLKNGVVHYGGTANPGVAGNSFITGHSSNYWWEKGNYNYVFANLNKLATGDQAKIYFNGNKYIYQVTSVKIVEANDMSVLSQTEKPTLTLMTCTPPGTSWKRLIVSFDQILPEYYAPMVVEEQKEITISNILPESDMNGFLDWLGVLFHFKKVN